MKRETESKASGPTREAFFCLERRGHRKKESFLERLLFHYVNIV